MTNHEQAKWYLDNLDALTYDQLADAMTYKWFRLNVLYHIKDKSGQKILFEPNIEQETFYLNQHCRDIILKARQLGFTTFKMISDLDDCLFNENFSAGCICHNLEDAKDIFRNKIKFAYKNISEVQRELLTDIGYELPIPENDKDNSYVFNNGSSIKVSVGYRGGTLQSLHVSEFGKICKKFPEKAKEIVTGAFEAVAAGNVITIESTAEGKEGYFYTYCTEAQKAQQLGKELSLLDFNFHFFSWYMRPEYSIKGEINPSLFDYFDELERKHGIELTDNQKAWYSSKWSTLGDDMKREYPTTPEEAFQQAIEGAYYEKQFRHIYANKQIRQFDEKSFDDVHTAWDLGIGDSTSIWFYRVVGNETHVIDYYENSGEGLEHYIEVLKNKPYRYKRHIAPHDIQNREFGSGGKSRKDIAAELGIYFEVCPRLSVDDGINNVRKLLPDCWFNELTTSQGVKCLESYRKEWNDKLGCWRDKPLHDWSSHGADAFRYLANTHPLMKKKMAPQGVIRIGY